MIELAMAGFMGFIASIVLVYLLIGAEGRAVLKAKTKKKPLAIMHRDDRKREFKVVDTETPEMWEINGYGRYNVNPDAIDTTPSGMRVADCPSNVGATIPPKYVRFLNKIKKKTGLGGYAEVETSGKKDKLKEKVAGEMISWTTFKNFLPILFSPIKISGAVERGVRARVPTELKQPWSTKKIMSVGIVIFIVVIAMIVLFESGIFEGVMSGGGTPTPPPGPIVVD